MFRKIIFLFTIVSSVLIYAQITSFNQGPLPVLKHTFDNLWVQFAATITSTSMEGNSGSGNNNTLMVGEGLRGDCSRYGFYWSVYSPNTYIDLSPYPHIVNGQVYDPYDGFGLYPRMDINTGQPINGGIPQLMDIEAHKIKFKQDIAALIPNPSYSGMINLDYEAWKPQWDLNWEPTPNSNVYKAASIELVKQQHPTWSDTAVIAEAKRQFEESAVNFYIATIDAAHEIRPQAKIGAFDLMYNSYWINFSDPVSGAPYRAYEDQIAAIWRKLDVIVVDVYQYFPSYNNGDPPNGTTSLPAGEAWYDENRRYIRENIWEGIRLKNLYPGSSQKLVIAYTWPQYHASQPTHGYELLRSADISLGVLYPYELGADGVVIWNNYLHPHFGEFPDYLRNIMGPMIENFCGTGTPPPPAGPNLAPRVNAGSERSVSLSTGTTLNGEVIDDGKPTPPGAVSMAWTQENGPGTAVLGSPNSPSTSVTFPVIGVYIFRLTASDGALSSSGTVRVVVNANAPTQEELLERIRELQEMIRVLQAQLAARNQSNSSVPRVPTPPKNSASYDLTVGSTGPAVTALQKFLVLKGFLKMSAGSAYGTFGPATKAALAKFQAAHLIWPANGYYGPVTRALVNRLK